MDFNYSGLIFVAGGVYAFLLAHGIVSASNDRDANEAWRRKYDRLLKISSPLVILFGLGEFFRLFA